MSAFATLWYVSQCASLAVVVSQGDDTHHAILTTNKLGKEEMVKASQAQLAVTTFSFSCFSCAACSCESISLCSASCACWTACVSASRLALRPCVRTAQL